MKIFIFEDELFNDWSGQVPRKVILTALKGHDLTIVERADDAGIKKYCANGPYGLWLLDFDVCGYPAHKDMPGCGYQLLLRLFKLKYAHGKPRIILHSQNAQGRNDMRGLLAKHGHTCEDFPFTSKFADFLKKEFPIG